MPPFHAPPSLNMFTRKMPTHVQSTSEVIQRPLRPLRVPGGWLTTKMGHGHDLGRLPGRLCHLSIGLLSPAPLFLQTSTHPLPLTLNQQSGFLRQFLCREKRNEQNFLSSLAACTTSGHNVLPACLPAFWGSTRPLVTSGSCSLLRPTQQARALVTDPSPPAVCKSHCFRPWGGEGLWRGAGEGSGPGQWRGERVYM